MALNWVPDHWRQEVLSLIQQCGVDFVHVRNRRFRRAHVGPGREYAEYWLRGKIRHMTLAMAEASRMMETMEEMAPRAIDADDAQSILENYTRFRRTRNSLRDVRELLTFCYSRLSLFVGVLNQMG
jgi:hypothetical protein